MFLQIIGAFLTVICFGICFEIPKKLLVYTGIAGASGWFVYLLMEHSKSGMAISVFIASLCVTILAHVGARVFKAPVTVFLIPGILPMVPGAGMYRTVYYYIQNDFTKTMDYLGETLKVAGAIALAIFIVDSVYRIFTKQKRYLKEIHFFKMSSK